MRDAPRLWTLVLVATLGAWLPGCAPLTADRCAGTDWYAAGLADGRAGLAADAILVHARECAAEDLNPDDQRYRAGREAGLADYCTLTGGISAGRSGYQYRDVCSGNSEEEFLTGFYLGALSADQ